MYLGLDLGISGVKALIIDADQAVVAEANISELDPANWVAAIKAVLQKLRLDHAGLFAKFRGIGLSGHMHGTVLLNKDHQVSRPCIMWSGIRSGASWPGSGASRL